MTNINCKTCYTFDFLAAVTFNKFCRDDMPEIKETIQGWLSEIDIPPSNSYFDLLVENYNLDEIEKFNTKQFVEKYSPVIKESNYDDSIKRQFLKAFEIMVREDFRSFWVNNCQSILEKQCAEYHQAFQDNHINGVMNDVNRIQRDKNIQNVDIYVTYFMFPISFFLTPYSYLTNYSIGKKLNTNSVISMLSHELCHRFSSKQTKRAYKDLCSTDSFLNKTNWFLLNIKGSGNEEEYVTALQHAIMVINGIESRKEAFEIMKTHYESCQPLTIILLDALLELNEIPENTDQWIREFTIRLKQSDIKKLINDIMPGFNDLFEETWKKNKIKYSEKMTEYEESVEFI